MARQIAALEDSTGVSLFHRHPSGYKLTRDGTALLKDAEDVERAMAQLRANAGTKTDSYSGIVRIAAPETITSRLLMPGLHLVLAQHPQLEIELITGTAQVGIALGEVDLAIRLVRPDRGALTVQRIAQMSHGLYAEDESHGDIKSSRLVGWTAAHDFPAVDWLRTITGRAPDIRVNNLETLRATIESGLAIGVLPRFMSGGLTRLETPPSPVEDIWLVADDTQQAEEKPVRRAGAL